MARATMIGSNDCMVGASCLRLSLKNSDGEMRLIPAHIENLLQALLSDRTSRLIVLEGITGSFCEGVDLNRLSQQLGEKTDAVGLAHFAQLLAAIGQVPQPVIALVDGQAMGGGVGLAAAADLVLASSKASFALPETVMGMIPAMVFPYIARRIGVPKARLMALGTKPLSAEAAFRIGLVDEVVDDLEGAYKRYARRFARMEPRAIGTMKTLIATHFTTPENYQIDAANRFHELLASQATRVRLKRFAVGQSPWTEESQQ
ncbi:MAG: enoyl-CoA hydratase-related protein [Cyanobacteria bacterium P01_F01_bin.86]